MTRDNYFLSEQNAIATIDQVEVEDIALRLVARPAMHKARGQIAYLWREVMEYPAQEQMAGFDAMLDEYMFHHALRAAVSDPGFPRIARFMAPPHHWFGRDVPGSRWAGDSPDFIYRVISAGHGGRYEIRGRRTCERAPTVNYALMSDNSAAPTILALLDSLDITTETNGDFTITVDEASAAGRTNHIQTRPGAYQIWVRDALGDWEAQSANALTIRRLNPSPSGPLSEYELAERAIRHAIDGAYYAYYCMRATTALPPNEIKAPTSSGPMGGMATQRTCRANVCLADDQAMIITTTAGGALFRNAVLQDVFMLSFDYWSRTTSFNMTQIAPDADGLFTYVIAHRDPGVHNWLDTGGRRQTIFGQRWQAFPATNSSAPPAVTWQLVKWEDLPKALPAGIRYTDVAGRRGQLVQRAAGFKRRFIDK